MNKSRRRLVCLIGPSASGKTTLAERLIENLNDKVALCASYTTRKLRTNEVNGQDYFFISNDEMNKLIDNDDILQKVEYCGKYKKYIIIIAYRCN